MDLEKTNPSHPIPITLDVAHSGVARALHRVVSTTDDAWPAILRVTLGIVMLPHALQKTLALFGGAGFTQTVQSFTTQLHLPAALAVLVIVIEQVGSLALVFGVFTRAAAAGIGAVMVGAIATVHWGNGFFMNWAGEQSGEGFEYHLLVLAIVAALLVGGGGRASIDRTLGGES